VKNLLIDGNNLFYSTLFIKEVSADPKNLLYDLWKYITFDKIIKLISNDVSEVIIAFDGPNNWRKAIYKKYKANRKKSRDKSQIDWEGFFVVYHNYIEEIANHFPFKVLLIDRCEADDIIAVLTDIVENPFICSSDEDFLQLPNDKVTIYNLKHNKIITDFPKNFLEIKCLIGQPKDNIPNIKTPLDWSENKRKPGFGIKSAEKVLEYGIEKWLEENALTERYKVNQYLIDFNKIPNIIKELIINKYKKYKKPKPGSHLSFFEKYKWKRFIDDIHFIDLKLSKLY